MKRIFLLVCAALGLASPGRGESELLRTLFLEGEGGVAMPQGNLSRHFDPVPEFGLRITSAYYGPLLAHILVHGARLDGPETPAPVWLGAGGVGLEYRPARAWLPAPGIGVSLNYGRVLKADVPAGREFFIEDGETEFGFYPSLRWRIPLGRTWFLTADLKEDLVMTEPKYSRTGAAHLGAGWRLK
ncbi:MAG TPA: hypothetical protein VJ385_21360 [Fibrobacteria bacterium]|nr:hypothetical protein [Fibrobacteria bacterium]